MLELAYVAGLFDGEGSVGMPAKDASFIVRVCVSNSNLDVITALKTQFGGMINTRKATANWKECHQWHMSYAKAVVFLETIYPWLVVKKKQAELVFETKKHRLGGGAWAGREADEHRAALLRIRHELMDVNAWSGNKTRHAKRLQVHPATLSTQKGWSRRGRRDEARATQ